MNRCPFCHAEVAPNALRCGRCHGGLDPRQADGIPGLQVSGVVAELDKTIPESDVMHSGEGGPGPPTDPTEPESRSTGDTQRYRPVERPPLATLCILDDGSRDHGEVIRLRRESTVMGRNEAKDRAPDIRIPHDASISTLHAEIVRGTSEVGVAWTLRDLDSQNGVFLRVDSSALKDQQGLMIGRHVLRFDRAIGVPTEQGVQHNQTVVLESPEDAPPPSPELVVIKRGGDQRYPLDQREVWIGRDLSCEIVFRDHTMDPRHTRLYESDNGLWHVEDNGSLNGVWIRISEVTLDDGAEFQLGEQRFLFRIP